jgi:hypothetical protein
VVACSPVCLQLQGRAAVQKSTTIHAQMMQLATPNHSSRVLELLLSSVVLSLVVLCNMSFLAPALPPPSSPRARVWVQHPQQQVQQRLPRAPLPRLLLLTQPRLERVVAQDVRQAGGAEVALPRGRLGGGGGAGWGGGGPAPGGRGGRRAGAGRQPGASAKRHKTMRQLHRHSAVILTCLTGANCSDMCHRRKLQ